MALVIEVMEVSESVNFVSVINRILLAFQTLTSQRLSAIAFGGLCD